MILNLVIAATAMLSWTMPTTYYNGIDTLSDGYRRWELGYSTQAQACKDSGLVWCNKIENYPKWWPSAQVKVILHGYARPGQHINQTELLVPSYDWPYTWWVRSYTDVLSPWSNPTISRP